MVNIDLKNIKVIQSMSEETFCFEATLYVDGQRFCSVGNHGQGGPNDYSPLPGSQAGAQNVVASKIDEINKELGNYRTPMPESLGGGHITPDIDILVGDRLNAYARDKEIKKVLKKISYYAPGDGIYSLPAKYKPTEETLEKYKKSKYWRPEYRLLNEMDMDELRELPEFRLEYPATYIKKEDIEEDPEQSSGPGL